VSKQSELRFKVMLCQFNYVLLSSIRGAVLKLTTADGFHLLLTST
jgi:hypothetical protein